MLEWQQTSERAFVTTHATFLSSHTCTSTNNWFLGLSRLYLAWKTKKAAEVASFLVLFCLGSWRDSSLTFCPTALVFTPVNSTKTLFSYGVRYNELRGKTRKLDAIKETGKSHIWPYLRATKWRLESNRMWHHVFIQRSLHILAYVQLALNVIVTFFVQ